MPLFMNAIVNVIAPRTRPSGPRPSSGLVTASLLCLTACGGRLTDTINAPEAASPRVYWALRLADHAINLSIAAPTNTMQLVATPMNANGEPLSGITAIPTFRALTPEVTVSSAGVVTAHTVGSGIQIIAELQLDGVTHADTAFVHITETAPATLPTTVSIDPVPPDSAKLSTRLFGTKTITPLDQSGNPITDVIFAYTSSDPTIARISNPFDPVTGALDAVTPGSAIVTASAYAYGVRFQDQATFIVGQPTFQLIGVVEKPGPGGTGTVTAFGLSDMIIGIGGDVAFSTVFMTRETGIAVEDVAGGPAPMCTGDLTALPAESFFATICTFPTAGTYRYRALDSDASGTITVKADTP